MKLKREERNFFFGDIKANPISINIYIENTCRDVSMDTIGTYL